MKLIPLITAILVTGFLYFLVFEREELLAFAQTGTPEAAKETDATPKATDEEDTSAIRVFAVKSQARMVDSAVILRGQTEAARSVEVRAQTSGQVISEPLRKGNYVNAGQLLCQIDFGTTPNIAPPSSLKRPATIGNRFMLISYG